MQEVSGSSPLSSTGQKPNSNNSNRQYSRKVQQRRPSGPPYVCSDRISPQQGAAGLTLTSRRWPACDLGKYASHRFCDSCHLATARLSWRSISARDCCRICKQSSRASRPGGPVYFQESRPLAMAPVADSRVGTRARRVAPMMSDRRCPLVRCAAQAQDCAVVQPCAPADAPREETRRAAEHGDFGRRPSGWPLRALTPPMPGSGRWRRTDARLGLCWSLAASPVSTGGNRSCPEGRPGTLAYRRVWTLAIAAERHSSNSQNIQFGAVQSYA
jgi:hypothetical protein